jgi:tetratricopeptide (TPR) repeat protein
MKLNPSSSKNPHVSEDWVIFRLDTQIKNQPVDIYMILDVLSDMLLAFKIVEDEILQKHADELLSEALAKKGSTPNKLLLTKGEPAECVFRKSAEDIGINLELVAASHLEEFIVPCRRYFGEQFYSPSSLAYVKEDDAEYSREELKYMIPDSYDLCSCASGKKYKFCCKKILREITEAMVAAEDGKLSDALEWITKAKQIVGETAEVLCRESIAYSFFDEQKSEGFLNKCLAVNPNHPRAHYLRGITLKKRGDFQGAIASYETAIAHYPLSDHYHLNEVYNNLGVVFHAVGDLVKAKLAWEKALLYMPKDKITQQNLTDFIYNKTNRVL